ncbi:Ribosomal protein S18 acetylase RimI [Promicromonospora thailandica]|uniref:Ribosomal protein S18 acetylase RimI n=1 Tax=Promicromonospora thailandica TaxID=765201 RepID=A0A9X2JU66_9MICO|nr:Ribosomal protein S18 acetylase RimI [Promicromonospora thailandica]BFF19091.1 GNAT family N-acetyltransferase [Promicromonospora thailandica]
MVRTLGRSDAAHDILEELPEWFGIDRFTHEYVDAAARFPNYVAVAPPEPGSDDVGADGGSVPAADVLGVLLLDQRYPTSAEVHLLAVRRKHHRTGIGRTLLGRVEDDLRAQGVRVLSVKTLGPSAADPGFDQTRAFYAACGFHPVEEFADLWAGDPCLLMVKPL